MRETTVARSYAEALFMLALQQRAAERFAAAFDELEAPLSSQPRLRLFLETPKVEPKEKKRVLVQALRGRVPQAFLNFVLLVIDKRRQRLLAEMAREYRALLDERLGRVHVQITLAREVDERTEREIAGELSAMLGRTAIPHLRVDPEILGGVVVRYGDRVLDGSVRRQLMSLRRRLLEAELPSTA